MHDSLLPMFYVVYNYTVTVKAVIESGWIMFIATQGMPHSLNAYTVVMVGTTVITVKMWL